MGAAEPGEIAALKRQAEGLQEALKAVQDRLDILSRNEPTVRIPAPAPVPPPRLLALVGLGSSAATALLCAAIFAALRADPAAELAPDALTPPPPRPTFVTPSPPTLIPIASAAPVKEPPPVPMPVKVESSSSLGSLTVVCLPSPCTQIVDNGVPLGRGHIFSRPALAGRHRLDLTGSNGVRKSVTVEVLPEQLKDVRIAFSEPPLDVPPLRD